jgi:transcriptional regulator with XRE-family HTH domain
MISRRPRDPSDLYVGNQIRIRRLSLKMSGIALASALGVSLVQFYLYESGKSRVRPSRLQQIADQLRVPVEYFFPRVSNSDSDVRPSPEAVQSLATPEGVRLSKAFLRIKSAALRSQIVSLVECIVRELEPQ